MASSVANSGQVSGCSFLQLPLEIRGMIYRLIFPNEAPKPADMNLFYTNSKLSTDAAVFFYLETTFVMHISMDQIYFLRESYNDEKPFLSNKKIYERIKKLNIEIDWHFNPYVGRMGSSGSIEKAAARMQKNIEGVCSALASFVRLEAIEIACYSKRIPSTGGGPDTSIPGPSLTNDLLRPFEVLQQKKPTTQIWITEIEDLTGLEPQDDELYRKPLKTIMTELADLLRDRSGTGCLTCRSTMRAML